MSDVLRTLVISDAEADFVVLEMLGAWLLEGVKEMVAVQLMTFHGARLLVDSSQFPGRLAGVYVKDKEGQAFNPIQRGRVYRVGMPRYMLARKKPKVFSERTVAVTKGAITTLLAAYIQSVGVVTAAGPVRDVTGIQDFLSIFRSRCIQSDVLSEEDAWRNGCFVSFGSYLERPDLLGLCPAGEVLNATTLLCAKCSAGEYMITRDISSKRFFSEPFVDSGASVLEEFVATEAPQHCAPCYMGQRSDEGQAVCSLCAAGRFNSVSGSSRCAACPSNTVAQELGSTSCRAAVGYYGDGLGAVRCPSESTTFQAGATSVLECVCITGTHLVYGACKQCGLFQTTAGPGADRCTKDIVFYIVFAFVPILALLIFFAVVAGFVFYSKLLQRLDVQRRRDKVKDCIRGTNVLAFPLVVMNGETFEGLGKLVPYEYASNKHLLWQFPTLQTVKHFLRQGRILFFSHQWLAWAEPDPSGVHYEAIVAATRAVVKQLRWPLRDCYLWVDYHSVPQLSKHLQALAIRTLPIFASLASIFVIVAPTAVQEDTGLTCDLSSYKRRMWCRAESFAYFCQRGIENMYLAEEEGQDMVLSPVAEEAIADTIQVFDGECACCARKHRGMESCDKELLRDVFLAIYSRVLWSQRCGQSSSKMLPRSSLRKEAVEGIVHRIQSRKDDIFPKSYTATFMPGSRDDVVSSWSLLGAGRSVSFKAETRPLFGQLVETLEEMLSEDADEIGALLLQPHPAEIGGHDLDLYPAQAVDVLAQKRGDAELL